MIWHVLDIMGVAGGLAGLSARYKWWLNDMRRRNAHPPTLQDAMAEYDRRVAATRPVFDQQVGKVNGKPRR